MERTRFDPFSDGWEFFRSFMSCGMGGRRFYTRKEQIEHLEKMKQRLQQEISGIEERIGDLKKQETK